MPQVSGQGTTYNLPNYRGELIGISPSNTPLLSASGGLTGGGITTKSTSFEWQLEDLRDGDIRARKEGDNAPGAEARARGVVENVVQVHHETVETSYTKLAASGQYRTPSAAPYQSNDGTDNPVINEHTHQVEIALRQIGKDVNYGFWHGKLVKPTDNSTPRQSAGLLSVVTSNRSASDEITELSSGSSNVISETSTGLSNGDKIVFTAPPAELRPDRVYYVVNKATDSFKVSDTLGGTALTVADSQSDIAYIPADNALGVDGVNGLILDVVNEGGLDDISAASIFCNPVQKVRLSKAYGDAYGKANPVVGNIGGVAVDAIVTDFGTLNVIMDRDLPPDALAVVSLNQLAPVFLEIPGKGVLFEEELARTGSSVKSQIYGEIGLQYGYEGAHGVLRGLAA